MYPYWGKITKAKDLQLHVTFTKEAEALSDLHEAAALLLIQL